MELKKKKQELEDLKTQLQYTWFKIQGQIDLLNEIEKEGGLTISVSKEGE